MHLTRAETTRKLPITRRGTTYVARPANHVHSSITVLAALRDMLHLARTARDVKEMIKEKKLKINGRVVRDYHETLTLLSVLEADKKYKLVILPTGRFNLIETKDSHRIAKVINKKMLKGKKIQTNLHDGTNILGGEKAQVGDSLSLDTSNKIVKVIPLAKGGHVLIWSGRNVGREGVIEHLEDGRITIRLENRSVSLSSEQVVAL